MTELKKLREQIRSAIEEIFRLRAWAEKECGDERFWEAYDFIPCCKQCGSREVWISAGNINKMYDYCSYECCQLHGQRIKKHGY